MTNMRREPCTSCPRRCQAEPGFCGAQRDARVAKIQPHFAEEPCISGTKGSGTVFFAGCNLRCAYCQNYRISAVRRECAEMPPEALSDVFLELQARGVHNINLVTPTPHMRVIGQAIEAARRAGLRLPVIYNTAAYENAEALKPLEGLIDVYLPDLKYYSDVYALRYSNAPGYWRTATRAVLEMARQAGEAVFDGEGLVQKGLIIRHLILPGLRKDSFQVLDWIRQNLPPSTYVSLLAQYFPEYRARECKELNRRITRFEYESVIEHFWNIGLRNGYRQDRTAAAETYVPAF